MFWYKYGLGNLTEVFLAQHKKLSLLFESCNVVCHPFQGHVVFVCQLGECVSCSTLVGTVHKCVYLRFAVVVAEKGAQVGISLTYSIVQRISVGSCCYRLYQGTARGVILIGDTVE